MVSFGEKCKYDCKYCYSFSRSFEGYPSRSTEQIFSKISILDEKNFDIIYVSCDMDSFVNQERALALLQKLSLLNKHIHFTTKSVLRSDIIDQINIVRKKLKKNGLFLIPAITIATIGSTAHYEPYPIARPVERAELLHKFKSLGFKTILAVRPFLPFVKISDYKQIIDIASSSCDAILGGVFYFDTAGDVERRLGGSIEEYNLTKLPFIKDSDIWKMYEGRKEQSFFTQYCRDLGKPFFMDSESALTYLCAKQNPEKRY